MTGKRVLIVEDEQIVAEELRGSLTAHGFEVVGVAHSGEQAIIQGAQSRPDVVVMDVVLSGSMDGISAAQHLRPLGIPVVYLSAYSDPTLRERAERTHPLAYVTKPANSGELAAAIQEALVKREQQGAPEEMVTGRREADEQVHLITERIAAYAIFTLDPAGNITSWNRGAEVINGYVSAEMIGKHYALLFTSEDRQHNVPEAELEGARQHGFADDSRWLVRQNGERYWAEGTLTAVRNDAGLVTGFAKVVRDATDRKQLEDALRSSEMRLRIALRAARMGSWHWDIRTNSDSIDDNLRQLFGLRAEQHIQTIQDFYNILHPDDRAGVEAAFEETRRTGVHLDTEFRVVRADGTERWFMDQGEVVSDANGEPLYMSGACVDITDRKQAEEALRLSEERFRLFANNVRDYALFQMDLEGRIVTWNSGAEHLFGYPSAEILGEPSARIFVPEDVAAGEHLREMRDAAALGRANDERWHWRKDGTRFWCSGVLTVVHDDQGRLRGYAKVMRDETERRKASQQLRASLDEKEILLKEIHHRVKNNLQVITSLLTLQSETTPDAAIREMFKEACNRVRSIADIHELLYRSPDLARIDFAAYVNRLGENLLAFNGLERNRFRLTVRAHGVALPISEAVPCGLIVNELLTNSLKHAFPETKSGNIHVSLESQGGKCVLEVADDGIGLPQDFGLEKAPSLGLQLVSVLAQQLRGVVHVKSSSGTRISIEFPHARDEKRDSGNESSRSDR